MILILVLLRGLLIGRAALVAEIALLRHQIAVLQRSVKRPRFGSHDLLLWILVSRVWRGWRECLVIVQPDTVAAWHRAKFRALWRWKSGWATRGKGGHPVSDTSTAPLTPPVGADGPLLINDPRPLLPRRCRCSVHAEHLRPTSPSGKMRFMHRSP